MLAKGAIGYALSSNGSRLTITADSPIKRAGGTRLTIGTSTRRSSPMNSCFPLTREDELRRALDDLFYSDSIERSLREAGLEQFEEWFPRDGEESDAAFSARIVAYGDRIFGGYSISHMSGRFRSSPLLSRSKAAELLAIDRRYLVDETTALVKFIIPIGASLQETSPDAGAQLQLPAPEAESTHDLTVDEEIRLVRQLFFSLFVEALIRNVAGEDEIWLIEESPAGRRLHVWKPA